MRKSIRLNEILDAVQSRDGLKPQVIVTLAPEDTGLPMVMCLWTQDIDRHGPRVGVSRKRGQQLELDGLVSVSISDDPRIVAGTGLLSQDLRLVRAWILLNKDPLLRHWNYGMPTADMMVALRPLGWPRGMK